MGRVPLFRPFRMERPAHFPGRLSRFGRLHAGGAGHDGGGVDFIHSAAAVIRCGFGGKVFVTDAITMGAKVKAAVCTRFIEVPHATLLFGSVAAARGEAKRRGEPGFWRLKR